MAELFLLMNFGELIRMYIYMYVYYIYILYEYIYIYTLWKKIHTPILFTLFYPRIPFICRPIPIGGRGTDRGLSYIRYLSKTYPSEKLTNICSMFEHVSNLSVLHYFWKKYFNWIRDGASIDTYGYHVYDIESYNIPGDVLKWWYPKSSKIGQF
jgi:hypothetical protein